MITCVKCLAESLAPGSRGETPARATAESVKMWSPCSKGRKNLFLFFILPFFFSLSQSVTVFFICCVTTGSPRQRTGGWRAAKVTGGLVAGEGGAVSQ